jgi:hypothetical protein
MIAGAPGSGKTSLRDLLRGRVPGMTVIDMDDFLNAAGALAGANLRSNAARSLWEPYNDLCLTLAASVVQSGVDLLLLTPLCPSEVDRSPVRSMLPTHIEWAVLDCDDGTRHRRLRDRGDALESIDEALTDARQLRELGCVVISNDRDIQDVVDAVVAWLTRVAR